MTAPRPADRPADARPWCSPASGILLAVAAFVLAVAAGAAAGPAPIGATGAEPVRGIEAANPSAGAPLLQPVGGGDTITSPIQTGDTTGGDDRSADGVWRIVFGAVVAAVILVALIQRRSGPEREAGRPKRPRTGGRKVLGH